jgi:tripartite-type tricarboxylate transporter receptor subunit TctC
MVFEEQFCLYLPAGASAEVVERLRAACEVASKSPEMAAGLAAFAMVPATSTPRELAALQKKELDRWGPVVRSVGFTADS